MKYSVGACKSSCEGIADVVFKYTSNGFPIILRVVCRGELDMQKGLRLQAFLQGGPDYWLPSLATSRRIQCALIGLTSRFIPQP